MPVNRTMIASGDITYSYRGWKIGELQLCELLTEKEIGKKARLLLEVED